MDFTDGVVICADHHQEDYDKLCNERLEGIAQTIGEQQTAQVRANDLPMIRSSLTAVKGN
jgi:hypothetical protein